MFNQNELTKILLEMLNCSIFFYISVFLIILVGLTENGFGFNSKIQSIAGSIARGIVSLPLEKIQAYYKEKMHKLNAQEFHTFKMRGVVPVARTRTKASRGYDKLHDILEQTKIKISGRVLSLCCGRGGWEQLYASSMAVTSVTAVTLGPDLGHEGHEVFRDWNWPGREKVRLLYADCKKLMPIDHDVLLFDGGESRTDAIEEVKKFRELLIGCIRPQLNTATRDFIWKILTPTDPHVLDFLEEVQTLTGKGGYVRCKHSRMSSMELYFVSTKKVNLRTQVRAILSDTFSRAQNLATLPLEYIPGPVIERSALTEKIPLLKQPNYDAVKKTLGPLAGEEKRRFIHWENLGTYPFGTAGSSSSQTVEIVGDMTSGLFNNLAGMTDWKATDTTASGFATVFHNKVDKPPKEDHDYISQMASTYKGLARHFLEAGFTLSDMDDEELLDSLNKAGAPGYKDVLFKNIGEYLQTDWKKDQERIRNEVRTNSCSQAVWNTIGKREKKKAKLKPAGSRMVAFMPIGMRVFETRKFGKLELLTKPINNRFGVGGLGLHDLGMRIAEIWKGSGTSSDIAGFDTKIGLNLLSMEFMFLKMLGADLECERLYEIYAHPLILIPKPSDFTRSELLLGRGQRMSGSRPTYAMNTITRIAIVACQLAYAMDALETVDMEVFAYNMLRGNKMQINGKEFDFSTVSGVVSGDDEAFMGPRDLVTAYAGAGSFLEEIGFPRKNLAPNALTPIAGSINEIEFCSHHYEKISYFDETTGKVVFRYMPTRDVSEIIGKSRLWLGGSPTGKMAEAWIGAQGNNLLVNYHHLKTVRALGCAFKSVIHPNLILIEKGYTYLPKPWMREGDILDVINECLFGNSTAYPEPNFRVHRFAHLGYLKPRAERTYDPGVNTKDRALWRNRLRFKCRHIIQTYNTGGNINFLDNWRPVISM